MKNNNRNNDKVKVKIDEIESYLVDCGYYENNDSNDGLSISYARDMYFDDNNSNHNSNHNDSNDTDFNTEQQRQQQRQQQDQQQRQQEQEQDQEQDQDQEIVSNVDAAWASGFISIGTILIVDEIIDDETNEIDEATMIDEKDNETIDDTNETYEADMSLLPSTIVRTNIHSKANCILITKRRKKDSSTTTTSDGGVTSSIGTGTIISIALETIKDINEGDEFICFIN